MLKPTKREKAGAVGWSDDDWSGGGLIDGEVKRSHRSARRSGMELSDHEGTATLNDKTEGGRVRGQKRQWSGP